MSVVILSTHSNRLAAKVSECAWLLWKTAGLQLCLSKTLWDGPLPHRLTTSRQVLRGCTGSWSQNTEGNPSVLLLFSLEAVCLLKHLDLALWEANSVNTMRSSSKYIGLKWDTLLSLIYWTCSRTFAATWNRIGQIPLEFREYLNETVTKLFLFWL